MKHVSATLSYYLGGHLLITTVLLFLLSGLLIFAFSVSWLIFGDQALGLPAAMKLAALKTPRLAELTMPYAALVGAVWTFARLARTGELIVARTTGASMWQFLTPPLMLALGLGLFQMAIFDPVASALAMRHDRLAAASPDRQRPLLAVTASGLWLRHPETGQTVLHAARLVQRSPEIELADVTFLPAPAGPRLHARRARLTGGNWLLNNAVIAQPPGGPPENQEIRETYLLASDLRAEHFRGGAAAPRSVSVWAQPAVIAMLHRVGLDDRAHRLEWHMVLSQPLLICALVVLGAVFSLRIMESPKLSDRRRGPVLAVGLLTLGCLVLLLSDGLHTLGADGALPPPLAAWTTAVLCALAAVFALRRVETQ